MNYKLGKDEKLQKFASSMTKYVSYPLFIPEEVILTKFHITVLIEMNAKTTYVAL